ncbi:MAG TPA: carbamate kinase [Nitrospirota bacterium]
MTSHTPPIVVAIGGNALIRRGERGTVEEQTAHASACMAHVAGLVRAGLPVVITHGNGPIVGNIIIQMECARDTVPPMPLYIADADSEGAVGFMLQQSLYNHLRRHIKGAGVVAVVTQVVVDRNDPAFVNPTKPVGPFYTESEAVTLAGERDWKMAEDSGRGWRRAVPSPRPLRIIEADSIKRVALSGDVVIAAGGGGVPVVEDEHGMLSGIDAVVDKDLASSVLALQIGSERMIILTSVDCVYLDYGKKGQRPLPVVNIKMAKRYLAEGQFPPGSMGPKIQAAVEFIEGGGVEVLVTSPEMLDDALAGKAGTRITL